MGRLFLARDIEMARTALRVAKFSCERARPLQRSLGPFAPEMPKKSRECLRGLRPRNPSPKSLQRVSKESFRTVPETFWRLFGVPGPEAPGDILETFSAFRARRAIFSHYLRPEISGSSNPKRPGRCWRSPGPGTGALSIF